MRFFVWTIWLGCGWLWYCIRPIGRHHTSGLSLLLSAIRFFFRSCAHCCIGGRQLALPATSKNAELNVPSGFGMQGCGPRPRPPPPPAPPAPRPAAPPAACAPPPCAAAPAAGAAAPPAGAAAPPPPAPPPRRPRPAFQTPEKSTLPSAVRGGGPVSTGTPFGSRGTSGVGYDGHCAPTVTETLMKTAIAEKILIPQCTT